MSPILTVTQPFGPRLYRESKAFPENEALQKLDRSHPSAEGSPESSGHPQALYCSHVIHWTENPAGAPEGPAQTVTSMETAEKVAQLIVGVSIFVFLGAGGAKDDVADKARAAAATIVANRCLLFIMCLSAGLSCVLRFLFPQALLGQIRTDLITQSTGLNCSIVPSDRCFEHRGGGLILD
jgi:hypothetical protein